MVTYIVAAAMACVACATLTPLARHVATRMGAVSYPGGRNVNHVVVPRMGGAAIYLGLLASVVATCAWNSTIEHAIRSQASLWLGLLVGATAMLAIGLVDDARGLKPSTKLLGQMAIAVGAFACGFRIATVWIPVVGYLSMGIFALPVTVAWIVGIVNAVNLVDGLDGLAAGVVLFAGITNFVVAILSGSMLVALVMAAMNGALVGFLMFNFNPARIFMGDSGSYLLGYVLATSALVGSQKTSTAVSLLVPCLALGVPIFDTLFSIVRRFLERRPIFSPDRGHLHHRLLDVGLTHRRAVLTLYAVSAIFSATSIFIWLGNEWQGGVALLVSTLVLFALVRFAGYFEYLQRSLLRRSRPRNPTVQSLRGLLPDLPLRLASATADRDLWVHVQRAAMAIGCPLVQIRSRGGPETDLLWEHRSPPSDELDLTDLAFPLGEGARARAQVLLSLPRADVSSPECEVLLLLFVDMLGRALSNLGSDLAPERAPVVGAQPSLPATCIPASEPTPHG